MNSFLLNFKRVEISIIINSEVETLRQGSK